MFNSLAEIKRANKAAGCHFFDKEAIGFFNSQPEPAIYGGRYFIDSIQFDEDSPRTYNVWRANPSGSVEHVYPQFFDKPVTREEAIAKAQELANS